MLLHYVIFKISRHFFFHPHDALYGNSYRSGTLGRIWILISNGNDLCDLCLQSFGLLYMVSFVVAQYRHLIVWMYNDGRYNKGTHNWLKLCFCRLGLMYMKDCKTVTISRTHNFCYMLDCKTIWYLASWIITTFFFKEKNDEIYYFFNIFAGLNLQHSKKKKKSIQPAREGGKIIELRFRLQLALVEISTPISSIFSDKFWIPYFFWGNIRI
jgi:hypothetical protein